MALVTANPGRAATARSTNRATASYCVSVAGSGGAQLGSPAAPAGGPGRQGGQAQGGHRVLALPRHAQGLAAGGQDRDAGARRQQLRDWGRRAGQEVLAVVQHQQHAALPQVVAQGRPSGRPAASRTPSA